MLIMIVVLILILIASVLFMNTINTNKCERFTNNIGISQSLNIINKINEIPNMNNIILLLLGKWLWNTYLVNSVSGINKIDSIWELFGISILIKLLIN